jgi:membrane-associated phospholipid phosphatase
MTPSAASLSERTHVSVARLSAVAVAACLASVALDRWAYEHLVYANVYEQDWGRLLRILGFWPTWIIAALCLWLNDRGAAGSARRRAWLLVASPAVAGMADELLKLLLRRERPDARHGEYVFRAFTDRPFSGAGIGSPSSHAAVAFGAAGVLTYLFPRARWVWLALAAGCALTRVLARAHFVSDAVGGAIVGVATAAWLTRVDAPRGSVPERLS